jgi:hypothetical protein
VFPFWLGCPGAFLVGARPTANEGVSDTHGFFLFFLSSLQDVATRASGPEDPVGAVKRRRHQHVDQA